MSLKLFSICAIAFTGDAPNRRCEFTQLTGDEGTHKKDNYLDNDTNIKVRSDEEIIEVIDKLYRNCGEYDKLKSNCEHLATFIRYGVKISKQVIIIVFCCC